MLNVGIAKVMEPLGAALNAQVLCLQYDFENPPETIENLAKSLIVVCLFVSLCHFKYAVMDKSKLIIIACIDCSILAVDFPWIRNSILLVIHSVVLLPWK